VHSVFGKINYGGLKHNSGTGTAIWDRASLKDILKNPDIIS
jgi:hypothetical protein